MNIGVPANEVVGFGARVGLFPVEDFASVYADETMRASLERSDSLPARYGGITQSVPVHRPNELYDTSLQMYVVEGPSKPESKLARELIEDARFTDLATNLRYWEERYRRIVDAPPERAGWLDDRARFARLQERYRAYAAAQLADVRRLLDGTVASAR